MLCSGNLADVAKVIATPRISPFCRRLRINVLILYSCSNSAEVNVRVLIGGHRARHIRFCVELLTDDGHAANAIFQEPEPLAVK